jgi:hypothetical protein
VAISPALIAAKDAMTNTISGLPVCGFDVGFQGDGQGKAQQAKKQGAWKIGTAWGLANGQASNAEPAFAPKLPPGTTEISLIPIGLSSAAALPARLALNDSSHWAANCCRRCCDVRRRSEVSPSARSCRSSPFANSSGWTSPLRWGSDLSTFHRPHAATGRSACRPLSEIY